MEKFNEALGEGYTKIKHKSGLDIYVIKKNMGSSYALFTTKYGSLANSFRLEGEKEFRSIPDGTAHFLEHKMFENEDGEDTFTKYARFGGNANAYTSAGRTSYLFSCTQNEHENLEVLLRFVTSPYFTEENVKKEQGIIGQEIKMYEDVAGWRLYFGMLQAMYKNNPVRIDTAGTVETISKITPEILYDCYSTFYDLSNMKLVVCGKFDVEKVTAVADSVLPNAKNVKYELAPFNEPAKVAKKKSECLLSVARPLFMIGVKSVNGENTGKAGLKKSIAMDIVTECLFGDGSDFYCDNYESGLINDSFGADFEQSYGYAHLVISGESEKPETVKKKVEELFAKTVEKGISKKDFERCKKVVYAKSIFAFENTESFASSVMNGLIMDWDALDVPAAIMSVKYSDVTAAAKELLVPDAVCMSVVKPL